MKKFLSLSSLFIFIIFLSVQTSLTSCTKEVTEYDTVTVTQTDTLVITDTTVTTAILTANAWKMQEFRGVIGNSITLYERGGTSNTENYDNEYIRFNADGTGTLFDAVGTTHALTWAFESGTTTQLSFVVSNPSPTPSQTVVYDNLRYKNKSLLFDQYWSYEGLNSHTQAVRIPSNN